MADTELHCMAHAVFVTDKQRRLDCAASALKAYHANDGVDSSENCQFIDLFADLLHLARSMGVDGEDCYRIGRGHYTFETNEASDEQA